MYLHEKISNKQPKAPKKNVEMTDRRSERRTDNNDFIHRTLCLRRPVYKDNLAISYLMDILLIILRYFGHFQSYQTKPNTFVKYWTFRNHSI